MIFCDMSHNPVDMDKLASQHNYQKNNRTKSHKTSYTNPGFDGK